jgi:hypothetical protein
MNLQAKLHSSTDTIALPKSIRRSIVVRWLTASVLAGGIAVGVGVNALRAGTDAPSKKPAPHTLPGHPGDDYWCVHHKPC